MMCVGRPQTPACSFALCLHSCPLIPRPCGGSGAAAPLSVCHIKPLPRRSPSQAWHLLLLRPTEYAAICNALAGAIINHNPSGVADEELREARLGLARATYKATFGTGSRDFIAKREAPAAAAAPAAKRADRKIQIVVQTLTGKKLNVTVSNDASVLDLMEVSVGFLLDSTRVWFSIDSTR